VLNSSRTREVEPDGKTSSALEIADRPTTLLQSTLGSQSREGDSPSEQSIESVRTNTLSEELTSRETPGAIDVELQRVLSSKTFSKAPRLKRFLEFVVRRALEGDRKTLKEYTLGLEVFDRLPSFDPSSNPIVRVEASRLRHRLALFYSTEGTAGSIRIDMPKGSYIPTMRAAAGERVQEASTAELLYKTLVVLPFSLIGNRSNEYPASFEAFSYQLMHLLTQSSEARVLSRLSSSHSRPEMNAQELGKYYGVQYIVEGTVILGRDEYWVLTYLVECSQGYNLWSGRYKVNGDSAFDTAGLFAVDLASALRCHPE
jgi:TolB-like protein